MPANLTPDYLAAEERFRAAQTTEEKLIALDEMYATIPKHKGTEKLRADIKRRISKLRSKEKLYGKKVKSFDEFNVEKQGAGQIVLLGLPNSGKSSLLNRLTSVKPDITEYSYSTTRPLPGMMEFEDISIQLVDTPPICGEATERGIINLTRNADAVAVVLDASDNTLLDQIEDIREELSKSRAVLVGDRSPDKDYPPGTFVKRTLIIANKMDCADSKDNLKVLNEFYGDEFDIITVSALTGDGLEELRRRMFDILRSHQDIYENAW